MPLRHPTKTHTQLLRCCSDQLPQASCWIALVALIAIMFHYQSLVITCRPAGFCGAAPSTTVDLFLCVGVKRMQVELFGWDDRMN